MLRPRSNLSSVEDLSSLEPILNFVFRLPTSGWISALITIVNHVPRETPTRVIDVGHYKSLIVTRSYVAEGRKGSWVALSHSWGREAHFVTDSENVLQKQMDIPLADLPYTFLDAMHVTRKLGQQYLWIGSLCM
jgi:Heterokaryon incompatibility protein (HET)